MDYEDETVDWSLLSGDDDMEHQAAVLGSSIGEYTMEERLSYTPGENLHRPAAWLNGVSRYILNDQAMRHLDEDITAGGRQEKDGWMTEAQLLGAGHRRDDLTDLAARGIIRTVVGLGNVRLYRMR
ncbi:MAG TPA: hypothetical protein VNA25_11150 [Phycisphaerae bacterium]|nr:hypothetical protein [Phycisphaerae bacterium]